ncbi:MAG: NAD(P)H-binding protein [Gammaproteobacteria bacterium]
MADFEPRTALLAGASGLVGGYVLDALLDAPDFGRVFAISRRPLQREHPQLANRIVQFDKLETQLKGTVCHVALCCLGTTLKQAGSEKGFRQVDLDYVIAFARAAREAQAQRFIVVSSAGAHPQSKHLYLRVKSEMEAALEALKFPALDIMQPGPLLGFRRELRPREMLATLLMPLLNPLLTGQRIAYRGISASTVGAAMLGAARSGRRGVYRYTYSALANLAESKPLRAAPAATPKSQSGAR